MNWRILASTPGALDTAHRGTDGKRIATCHLPHDTTPTDTDFEQAIYFALERWRPLVMW